MKTEVAVLGRLPVPNGPYGLCGRKLSNTELEVELVLYFRFRLIKGNQTNIKRHVSHQWIGMKERTDTARISQSIPRQDCRLVKKIDISRLTAFWLFVFELM